MEKDTIFVLVLTILNGFFFAFWTIDDIVDKKCNGAPYKALISAFFFCLSAVIIAYHIK